MLGEEEGKSKRSGKRTGLIEIFVAALRSFKDRSWEWSQDGYHLGQVRLCRIVGGRCCLAVET